MPLNPVARAHNRLIREAARRYADEGFQSKVDVYDLLDRVATEQGGEVLAYWSQAKDSQVQYGTLKSAVLKEMTTRYDAAHGERGPRGPQNPKA